MKVAKNGKKEKACPCVLHADSRHYPDLCPALSLHATPHLHVFFLKLMRHLLLLSPFTSSSFPPKAGGTLQAGWLPEGPPLCLGPVLLFWSESLTCVLYPLLLLNPYSCFGSLVSWKPESSAFSFVWDASFVILPWPKTSYLA